MGRPRTEDRGDERRCSKCRDWKPRTSEFFRINKALPSGLTGTCRECMAAYHRDWKNDPVRKERLAKERQRRYREDEGRKHRKRERERWLRSPERRCAQRLRTGMQDRHRTKGIPYDREFFTTRTVAAMLEAQPTCPCCGRRFEMVPNGKRRNESVTMDRLIPERGYVQGNVSLLCWRCNNLKRDAVPEELELVAAWMRRRLNEIEGEVA